MTETPFDQNMTLREAQDLLRTLLDEGHKCPCCTQLAKVYKRPIHSTMARDLIALYRRAGRQTGADHAVAISNLKPDNPGDFAKLRYWSLTGELSGVRDDGSSRVGWWFVTEAGERFLRGQHTVPKHARIYDGRCLGLAGDHVDITACLGKRFNYAELMYS